MSADTKSAPPVYRLWIELSPNTQATGSDINVQAILSEGAAYVDKKLAEMNIIYANFRAGNMIGPLSVSEVNTGTFATVISTLKKRLPVTEGQLKVPRITADPQLIEVCKILK